MHKKVGELKIHFFSDGRIEVVGNGKKGVFTTAFDVKKVVECTTNKK